MGSCFFVGFVMMKPKGWIGWIYSVPLGSTMPYPSGPMWWTRGVRLIGVKKKWFIWGLSFDAQVAFVIRVDIFGLEVHVKRAKRRLGGRNCEKTYWFSKKNRTFAAFFARMRASAYAWRSEI